MTADVKAGGVSHLRQSVIIYKDIKRIDFVQDMDKLPSGYTHQQYRAGSTANKEAMFYALPFNVPEFQIRHELPGAVVEPIADQSVGSTTSFYGIQHFSDIFNSSYGVTVATVECPLIEYGTPRHSRPWKNESVLKKAANSYIYMYLMNNWFMTNTYFDQRGPMRFTWSIRSHEGDWKHGKAHQFGWDISHPLIPRVVIGKQRGNLPVEQAGLLEIDQDNVTVSTLKPAEANGSGLILRCNELTGKKTLVTVTLSFLKKISRANETSLIEVDRPLPVKIKDGNRIEFLMAPHAVKTIRILCDSNPLSVRKLRANPVADMQVDLSWECDNVDVSHYNIYRDTTPEFEPSSRFLVGHAAAPSYADVPEFNYGGLGNKLHPDTLYYYKISVIDRWNNEGPVSDVVKVRTPSAATKDLVPVKANGLHAYCVSTGGDSNFVGLWFYTNPEADVVAYEIHRSKERGFTPCKSTLLKKYDATAVFDHTTPHGFKRISRPLKDYDRQLYTDMSVDADTTYYYKICAIDAAGQKGPLTEEAAVTTKPPSILDKCGKYTSAQSSYSSIYAPVMAIDGSGFWNDSWVSSPYGGGTKHAPQDVWWAMTFPETIKIKGIKKVGDNRGVIPLLKNFQIQIPDGQEWKTIREVKDASTKTTTSLFDEVVETKGIRIFVPAKDLPSSQKLSVDGIVRICELILLCPDGSEKRPSELF
ncbi:MAG: hypothetical protein GY801_37800 [bacterium]|nr:hypothetical protein [bacterium]